MYTQDSIDKIRDVDIVELIQNYVELKRSGANYKGSSPFKAEKTPSFMVSPVKNIFKCFATGKGGDGISFIQQIEGVTFYKAIEIIAQKCNVFLEKNANTEEDQKRYSEQQTKKAFITSVSTQYAIKYNALPNEHWAKEMIASRGYDHDVCVEFQLGFAPSENLISKASVQNAQLELAKEVGLVKVGNGKSYDFFRERIMFPIMDRNGQVVAFGGRRSNKEQDAKYAKYLNSPESSIYDKSKILYGLHLAAIHMRRLNTAIIVEGYTDVISMHSKGANHTVATCGTALTEDHAGALRRLVDHVIIFRDGDSAGIKATLRDIDILLATGSRVSVLIPEEGQDPDTIAQGQVDMLSFVNEYAIDAVIWKAEYGLAISEDNPTAKANALNAVIETICVIDNTITRDEYIKKISKIYGQSVRTVKTEVKQHLSKQFEKRKREAEKNGTSQLPGMPEGADPEEYFDKGFCTIKNEFWMLMKEGWKPVTNFRMVPLFHIKSGGPDTPRLFEIVNNRGKKSLIEVPASVIINYTQMRAQLISAGLFTFDINLTNLQFQIIMHNLLEECIEAKPFTYFGWQSKGFFAFANGIYQNGAFKEVNKFGIVVVEDLEEVESEYYDNTPHYYSPAFNETNKFMDDDQDEYENDRSFVFKKAKPTLDQWMAQVIKVYGIKGNLAIGFAFASLFRDIILSRYNFFPHLFLSGEKGCGKSKFGDTIHKLFTYKLAPFDLNSGTKVGFYRRLARLKNTVAFFEEYKDSIDDGIFDSIKGAYDGRGREKGMMTNDNRTTISKVNSSMLITSQYLPNRDDNSVSERSIIIPFTKRDDYSKEDLQNYYTLKTWEEEGLSSLILDIIEHRNLVEQNFHDQFSNNINKFKKDLEGNEYKERILNNFCAIYTPISILYKSFHFPFTLDEYYVQCVNGIIDNSDMLSETEGLSEFWNTLEKLFERGQIKEGIHFVINKPISDTINPKKGKKEQWSNTDRNDVLYLRLNSVHQDYVNEVSRRDGVDVIGEGSLRNYFKAKRYFIGPKQAHRFGEKTTSCYVFNYDIMKQAGVVNFDPITAPNNTPDVPAGVPDPTLFNSKPKTDEELPFGNS